MTVGHRGRAAFLSKDKGLGGENSPRQDYIMPLIPANAGTQIVWLHRIVQAADQKPPRPDLGH